MGTFPASGGHLNLNPQPPSNVGPYQRPEKSIIYHDADPNNPFPNELLVRH